MTSVPSGFRGVAMPFEPRLNKTMLRIGKTVHEASRRWEAALRLLWILFRAWLRLAVRHLTVGFLTGWPSQDRSGIVFRRMFPVAQCKETGSVIVDEVREVIRCRTA